MLRKPSGEHKREAVVVFNPENGNGNSFSAVLTRKKRVAAYARVSTEQDAQQNSYEAQIEFYTGYIQSKPEWEFVGIYADEGITGTSTKRREGFNRMVDDALGGKIDLILTKSISRFSRNTVDALTITRKLRAAGVAVFFEKENINSMDSNAEMIFTILCTTAQEESRSISENVRWGMQRSMEAGKINLAYSSFLGYTKGEDGLPKIVEDEAKIVREIYQLYLQGNNLYNIAEILTRKGYPTPRKRRNWSVSTVRSILTNEKYKGDARLQKTYTVDFLTKEVRVNKGERKQWYIRDSHDAIVSPETFELVQQELKRRTGRGGKFYDSPFTGKIICGDCGAFYGHRVWHSNSKYRQHIWLCNDKYKNGTKCNPPRVTDVEIMNAFLIVVNQLINEKGHFTDAFEDNYMCMISDTRPLEKEKETIASEISDLNDQIERVIHVNATRSQDQQAYLNQFNDLIARVEAKKIKLKDLDRQISELLVRKQNVMIFLEGLKKLGKTINQFDIPSWHALVEYVKVMPDRTLLFQMRNGSTISVELEAAKRGI